LLSTHREALDRVVALLLERETIDGSEVIAAAGEPLETRVVPEAEDRATAPSR
jgi:hypothetical protein